jgi:hypothetical protein
MSTEEITFWILGLVLTNLATFYFTRRSEKREDEREIKKEQNEQKQKEELAEFNAPFIEPQTIFVTTPLVATWTPNGSSPINKLYVTLKNSGRSEARNITSKDIVSIHNQTINPIPPSSTLPAIHNATQYPEQFCINDNILDVFKRENPQEIISPEITYEDHVGNKWKTLFEIKMSEPSYRNDGSQWDGTLTGAKLEFVKIKRVKYENTN